VSKCVDSLRAHKGREVNFVRTNAHNFAYNNIQSVMMHRRREAHSHVITVLLVEVVNVVRSSATSRFIGQDHGCVSGVPRAGDVG
jgi:hypothetical protein